MGGDLSGRGGDDRWRRGALLRVAHTFAEKLLIIERRLGRCVEQGHLNVREAEDFCLDGVER
jgi:hypothetical protein